MPRLAKHPGKLLFFCMFPAEQNIFHLKQKLRKRHSKSKMCLHDNYFNSAIISFSSISVSAFYRLKAMWVASLRIYPIKKQCHAAATK